jgi:small-conductance mechanosensitive channel
MYKRIRLTTLACFAALLLALTPLWAQVTTPTTPSVPDQAPVSVQLQGQTLFQIQTRARFPSIRDRAQRIEQRIRTFAQQQTIPLDNLATQEGEGGTLIYADDLVLVLVSDADAKAAGLSRNLLAQRYLEAIRGAVQIFREERSAEYLARAAAIALLSTFLLLLFLLVLGKVMPHFYRWLNEQRNRRIPSLHIQNLELLSSSQLSDLLQEFTQLVWLALVLGLLYLYLSFVLSLFPQTQNLASTLLQYVGNALGFSWKTFVGYLPNLTTIALICVSTYYVIRFLKLIFKGLSRQAFSIPGFYPEWAQPTFRLVTFLAIALAFALAFPFLPGASSPAFQGVSIFLGALVSLGATGAVSNMVAGFILIYTRAFHVGDRVQIGETVGDVEEKLMLVTRIRTLNNNLVTIPNGSLLSSNIINYSALIRDSNTPLLLSTTVTLGYDIPWRSIHQALMDAAQVTPDILSDPAPFVLQRALNDFYVSYELKAATRHPERMLEIYSALHQNIQDSCNTVGIEICSPHYAALRDGNPSTIPAQYLPPNYQAPAFRVDPKTHEP